MQYYFCNFNEITKTKMMENKIFIHLKIVHKLL